MPTTERSELPKRSSSRTLPSSLGALPKHLGRLILPPHTRRCSSYLSELSHQAPSAMLKKRDNHDDSQVCLDRTNKRRELPLILTLHFLNSDNGSRLLVHDSSEMSFTLHNDIGAPILRHRAGRRKTTSSMGSTSCAMTASAAFDGFLRVLLITTMSEVKLVMTKQGKGMNEP